jgi:hypothetical protein
MHKSATKCNETLGKWCKNNHGGPKIMDTLETYQAPQGQDQPSQGRDDDGGYIPSKGHITAMIQLVPKSNKEEKSIT